MASPPTRVCGIWFHAVFRTWANPPGSGSCAVYARVCTAVGTHRSAELLPFMGMLPFMEHGIAQREAGGRLRRRDDLRRRGVAYPTVGHQRVDCNVGTPTRAEKTMENRMSNTAYSFAEAQSLAKRGFRFYLERSIAQDVVPKLTGWKRISTNDRGDVLVALEDETLFEIL